MNLIFFVFFDESLLLVQSSSMTTFAIVTSFSKSFQNAFSLKSLSLLLLLSFDSFVFSNCIVNLFIFVYARFRFCFVFVNRFSNRLQRFLKIAFSNSKRVTRDWIRFWITKMYFLLRRHACMNLINFTRHFSTTTKIMRLLRSIRKHFHSIFFIALLNCSAN